MPNNFDKLVLDWDDRNIAVHTTFLYFLCKMQVLVIRIVYCHAIDIIFLLGWVAPTLLFKNLQCYFTAEIQSKYLVCEIEFRNLNFAHPLTRYCRLVQYEITYTFIYFILFCQCHLLILFIYTVFWSSVQDK